MTHVSTYTVGYNSFRNHWVIYLEDGKGRRRGIYQKKKKAVKKARELAKNDKPSELIVGNREGTDTTEETTYGVSYP